MEPYTEAEGVFVSVGSGEGGLSFDLSATGRKINSICSSVLLRNKEGERNLRPVSFPFVLPFSQMDQKMIPCYSPPSLC